MSEKKVFNETSVFLFGKYKGKSLAEIMDDDPMYLQWCLDEGIFSVTTPLKRKIEGLADEQEYQLEEQQAEEYGYYGDRT